MTLLDIDGLNAYYGQSHVLHDVAIEVDDDEIVALLGRNGAGKTTTIRSVMNSGPRVEGRVVFKGTDIRGDTPEAIFHRGIAWVPEEQRTFPNLTVRENLRMGLPSDRDAEAAFAEIFDIFTRLGERENQKARTMSGGERQMLVLGRALISDPNLLLVDEPFEGLMPALVDELAETMAELADRDMSMILAEQRIDLALDLADRVYVIEKGEVKHTEEAASFAADETLQQEYLGVS